MPNNRANVEETHEAFTALSTTALQLQGAGIAQASVLAAAVQLVRVLIVDSEDRSIIQQVVEALIPR